VVDGWLIILVYLEYAKTSNLLAVTIYGIMLIGGQTAQIGKPLQASSFTMLFPTWMTSPER
jgi:hypothetical protein